MRRVLCLFLLPVFLLLIPARPVSALESGFETEEMPQDRQEQFVSNIDFAFFLEKPAERQIECFDVHEDGRIVMGHVGPGIFESGQKLVCVYSADGVFQYGYSFDTEQGFGVEWDGDNVNIWFVRSDVLMQVDPQGTVLRVAQVPNTGENSTWSRHLISDPVRTSQDSVYRIRNNLGILNLAAFSYSQLIVSGPDGETTLLYDVRSWQLFCILSRCFVCVLVVLVTVAVVAYQVRKKFRQNKDSDSGAGPSDRDRC